MCKCNSIALAIRTSNRMRLSAFELGNRTFPTPLIYTDIDITLSSPLCSLLPAPIYQQPPNIRVQTSLSLSLRFFSRNAQAFETKWIAWYGFCWLKNGNSTNSKGTERFVVGCPWMPWRNVLSSRKLFGNGFQTYFVGMLQPKPLPTLHCTGYGIGLGKLLCAQALLTVC